MAISDGQYTVSIGAGGEDGLGYVNIVLPQVNFPEFYNADLIENLIVHLTDVVDLTSAYSITDSVFDAVVDFDKKHDIQIGWVNYFKNKEVLKYMPIDVQCKTLPKGVMLRLSDEISKPSEALLKRSIDIRDALGELGLLETQ